MSEISPRELHARRAVEAVVLVDVREPCEYELCHLEDSILIPLETLPARHTELSPSALTVLVCHHGIRSRYAVEYLRSAGFQRVLNLSGGIHRWAIEIDKEMPRY